MAIRAFAAGAGEDANAEESLPQALAQARREAVTLRGVLEAIQDALSAATSRLEVLETQVTGELGETGDLADGAFVAGELPLTRPPAAASHGAARTAGWKIPGWGPAEESPISAESLRVRREALGISQAAVAHAAHCSRGLVAEVERGKRRSAQTLAHLASVLDRLEQQARRN